MCVCAKPDVQYASVLGCDGFSTCTPEGERNLKQVIERSLNAIAPVRPADVDTKRRFDWVSKPLLTIQSCRNTGKFVQLQPIVLSCLTSPRALYVLIWKDCKTWTESVREALEPRKSERLKLLELHELLKNQKQAAAGWFLCLVKCLAFQKSRAASLGPQHSSNIARRKTQWEWSSRQKWRRITRGQRWVCRWLLHSPHSFHILL